MKYKNREKRLEARKSDFERFIEKVANKDAFRKPGSLNK